MSEESKDSLMIVELPNDLDADTKGRLKELAKKSAKNPKVVITKNPSFALLKELSQLQNVLKILETQDPDEIERLRVESSPDNNKDQKSRERANKRIITLNRQVESLHQALVAVHTANSIGDVESLLLRALKDTLDLEWCRIFFRYHEHMEAQLDRYGHLSLFKAALTIGQTQFGKIIFARTKEKPFSKSENDLLLQVADGVALAIDRLTKLDQAESLKQQWESTFDAISEPLCLTDEKFKIIRTNSAFAKVSGLNYKTLIGANCFISFFGASSATQDIAAKIVEGQRQADHTFKVQKISSAHGKGEDSLRTYEVSAQKIQQDSIFMILFRDITDQQKIQKQIFESAKMAEIGTIGSSIAHELNNPLGGMISFLQLLRMDLKKEDTIYPDIIEMEQAGQRCKEIVENLLGFTRQHDPQAVAEVDLRDVVRQALKITELQARSLGVTVQMLWPEHPVKILGHSNLLAQAISHFLQNSFEAVSEKLTENPRYKGHIQIDLRAEKSEVFLNIGDNGVGISPENQNKIFNPLFSTKSRRRNQGLGLTLAYKIIDDHKGRIEISSQPKMGTQVKIALTSV
jgi:two-component system NtrC family sensor kinase